MAKNNSFKRCLRVGITGGIGSGKSTACRMFEALGIPVYDADYWAKWLIVNDPDLRNRLLHIFGPEVYAADGTYNRTFVASLVFSHPEKLAALNAAVHPAVERHSRQWHASEAQKDLPYTLKESALLVESQSHLFLDALIVVTAPERLRIHRVMQRDQTTEAAVRARMQHQLPEAEKLALADFVLTNDGQELLLPQVWTVHQQLLVRARADF